MEQNLPRKLAVILHADVVGYSRLAGADEDATHRKLKESLGTIFSLVSDYHGHVISTAGDAVLAMFEAAVDAVSCAVAIQQDLATKSRDSAEEQKVLFRIGINLGDVIEDAGDIYGDGVNVAARLEGLAEPGGICIAESVYTSVGSKLPLEFKDIGAQTVKNISEPIKAYRVRLEYGEVLPPPSKRESPAVQTKLIRSTTIALLVVVLLVVGGAISWIKLWKTEEELASNERMALPLPDKPSIAVLPFKNITDKPEDDWFADGMAADLITDLSKISGLFVIARSSSFNYKGKSDDIETIGRGLGVRYILDGSVQSITDHIRINVQLVDTSTGGQIWAERFAESRNNIYAIQDKVMDRIISELALKLSSSEQQHVWLKETDSAAAYEAFLRGREHFRRQTPADIKLALDYYQQAVEIDPKFARAQAALALVYYRAFEAGWARELGVSWNVARLRSGRHLQLSWNAPTSLAHRVTVEMFLRVGRTKEALEHAQKALILEPNDPENQIAVARVLIFLGRENEALDLINSAMRLDALYPAEYLYFRGLAQFGLELFEESIDTIRESLARNPNNRRATGLLAAAYAQVGRTGEAQSAFKEYEEQRADNTQYGRWSQRDLWHQWPYKNQPDWERLLDGLSKASGRVFTFGHWGDPLPDFIQSQ